MSALFQTSELILTLFLFSKHRLCWSFKTKENPFLEGQYCLADPSSRFSTLACHELSEWEKILWGKEEESLYQNEELKIKLVCKY